MVGPWDPDMPSNFVLEVSVTVYLDEINILTSGLWIKQIALYKLGEAHPNSWRSEQNKRPTHLSYRDFCQQMDFHFNYNVSSSWCSSCQPTLQLNLSASIITWTDFLKQISYCIYTKPIGSTFLENLKLIHDFNGQTVPSTNKH